MHIDFRSKFKAYMKTLSPVPRHSYCHETSVTVSVYCWLFAALPLLSCNVLMSLRAKDAEATSAILEAGM